MRIYDVKLENRNFSAYFESQPSRKSETTSIPPALTQSCVRAANSRGGKSNDLIEKMNQVLRVSQTPLISFFAI